MGRVTVLMEQKGQRGDSPVLFAGSFWRAFWGFGQIPRTTTAATGSPASWWQAVLLGMLSAGQVRQATETTGVERDFKRSLGDQLLECAPLRTVGKGLLRPRHRRSSAVGRS